MKKYIGSLLVIMLFAACNRTQSPHKPLLSADTSVDTPVDIIATVETVLSDREIKLTNAGLIDVATLDEGIMVHLVYATPYNFTGKVLYHDIRYAFLQPDVAKKLLNACKALKMIRPDLTFIVYDAARPISVQKEMWNLVKGTLWSYYVKNPDNGGGLHNYGAAVDLSLIDSTGQPLSMGTPFDYFGYEANTDKETELVRAGRITQRELENRLLLRKVMTEAGFRTVTSEWWHFNSCTLEDAKQMYKLIE